MNNKGFAITGIIYTLFILFLLILLSVLSNLRTFQKLMINSTEPLEKTFEGIAITEEQLTNIKTNGVVSYTGKYTFEIKFRGLSESITCSTYLNKGTTLDADNIIFSPDGCNNKDYPIESLQLISGYNFEGEN